MVNTINAAAINSSQPYTPPPSNDPKVIAGEMFVELKAIENTLSKLDPQIIAAKLMKDMTKLAAKEGIKLTPEELKKMSDDAQKMASQIAYDRATGDYYPTLLSNEVNTLNNTYYQDITLGLEPGSGQPQLPAGPETDILLGLTYEIGTALGSFSYTPSSPQGTNPINILEAAGQGPDAMREFLIAVINQPEEMNGALNSLNQITNQMETLLGIGGSSSSTEIDASDIDASEIDAAAKPTPLFDAGMKGSEIDAGAKFAALIDAAAMPSSLIDV